MAPPDNGNRPDDYRTGSQDDDHSTKSAISVECNADAATTLAAYLDATR